MYHFDPKNFNAPQREAVLHREGPILVLAGAGSGKTRIIAHRIAYLLSAGLASASEIVALSFTNKAARELKARVLQLVGAAAQPCQLSTFHALGANILRQNIEHLGWKLPFAIIDGEEQRVILKNILKDSRLSGSSFDPEALQAFIARAKTAALQPLDLPGMRWNPQGRSLARIYEQYQSIRKSLNVVDFDDLIALSVELFEAFPEIAERYREAWRYLLVDEYQDTNALQFKLLRLLCQKRQNLMVVGDDDQSIYAFRGADSSHILSFPKQFSGVKFIALEQNYRSTRNILAAANAVILKNAKRHPKALWSESEAGPKIQVLSCPDNEAEARAVLDCALDIRSTKDLRYADIALLYRTKPQSRALEEACLRARLPYRIVGGAKFFDHSEVRDLLFYLRSVYAFHDELALRRIVNVPRRGLKAKDLERIDRRCKEEKLSYFESLKAELEGEELGANTHLKLEKLIQTLERFHKRLFSKTEALSLFLSALIEDLHFYEYIQSNSSSDAQAMHRRENIEELLSALAEHEQREGRDLLSFLQAVAIELPQSRKEEQQDVISLMTLHASKGLEFPIVAIVGCEEDILPHQQSLQEPALSEERRLFYVGITRSKAWLLLSYCRKRRKLYEQVEVQASRFLDDIPKDLLTYDDSQLQKLENERQNMIQQNLSNMRALFGKQ